MNNARAFSHIFVSILLSFVVTANATSSQLLSSSASDSSIASKYSKYIWYGKTADDNSNIMLVASVKSKDTDDVVLTGYNLEQTTGCNSITKLFEVNGFWVSALEEMKVYRAPNQQMLYVAVVGGGASTTGTWVVGIDKNNNAKTIYEGMNRGEPKFRIYNGVPEVREVWEIARLMDKDWRPTKQYDNHVLVERIYRLNSKDVFELQLTRPALEEERKLSKSEYERLLADRRDYESRNLK